MGRAKIQYLKGDATPKVQPFIHTLPHELPHGPLLHYKTIFDRLFKHVDAHNEAQTSLHYRIRLGALGTLSIIIKNYVAELRSLVHSPVYADSDVLPSIRTNNPRLAYLAKVSQRTIPNHLKMLEEAGLVQKVFHGWQSDFELWINPWILFGDSYPAIPVKCIISTNPITFTPHRMQSCVTKNTQITKETTITNFKADVDGVENPESNQEARHRPRILQGAEDAKDFTKERGQGHPAVQVKTIIQGITDAVAQKNETGGGATVSNVDKPATGPEIAKNEADNLTKIGVNTDKGTGKGGANGHGVTPTAAPAISIMDELAILDAPGRLRHFQKSLIRAFWEHTRQCFWSEEHFSEAHTRDICNILWNDVFNCFIHCDTEDQSVNWYLRRLSQFEKARKYAVKVGWVSALPPKCYYGLRFYNEQTAKGQRGSFHYTTKWLVADEAADKRMEDQKLLKKALKSIIGKKAPRGLDGGSDMTQISIYQYWQGRVKKLNDSVLLAQFEEEVVASLNGFKSYKNIEFASTPVKMSVPSKM